MRKYGMLLSIFGAIVLAGGIMGYIKAGSVISLVMGAFFASLLFFSAFFCYKEKISGLYVGTFSTLFLNFFFLYRFFITFKIMPAGLMVIISTLFAIPLTLQLTKRIQESRFE